jgi:hypothetical protein
MRPILVCGLLLILADSVFVAGQEKKREEKGVAQAESKSTNDQIEVNADRFSSITTVILKPQIILDKPDHQMTIEIKTKLGEKGLTEWEKDDLMAMVKIESQSKDIVKFGDDQVGFIVDGKPLDILETQASTDPYASRYNRLKPGFKINHSFSTALNRRDLEKLGKAGRVEMRVGPIELTLSQPVVTILHEYAKQTLAQHKMVRERKP